VNEQSQTPISQLLADHSLITEAIRRAVREAVLEHARAGRPVATWQDGRVVWIPAEEILSRLANGPASGKQAESSMTTRLESAPDPEPIE
jgi:hypothetical protein